MYRVTKDLRFCYGHRLMNYEGRCRFLHGHNGRAVVTLEGPDLDERGLLTDFHEIKDSLGRWIDDRLDHRMVLHRDDPYCQILRAQGEQVLEMDCNPTAENLAKLLFEVAREFGFPVTQVEFWETDTSHAAFTGPRRAAP